MPIEVRPRLVVTEAGAGVVSIDFGGQNVVNDAVIRGRHNTLVRSVTYTTVLKSPFHRRSVRKDARATTPFTISVGYVHLHRISISNIRAGQLRDGQFGPGFDCDDDPCTVANTKRHGHWTYSRIMNNGVSATHTGFSIGRQPENTVIRYYV